MKVDQVRDSVNCRVDEVRYFVKIVGPRRSEGRPSEGRPSEGRPSGL